MSVKFFAYRHNRLSLFLPMRLLGLVAILLSCISCTSSAVPTHGASVGDISTTTAVIWSRSDRDAVMYVRLKPENGGQTLSQKTIVTSDSDYTGKIVIRGLEPDTRYRYAVWFRSVTELATSGQEAVGAFRTAPLPSTPKPIRFVWSSDLAGQNVCQDADEGFPIFRKIAAQKPDLFVATGDMIYADSKCRETGRYGNRQVPGEFRSARTLSDFWAHWRYSLMEANYRDLLSGTVVLATWDDHEVINNFGPHHDTGKQPADDTSVHLMPLGLKAFLHYNPVQEQERFPGRLYRSIRWGKHLELFLLDTRQYRDANQKSDTGAQPKSMLGLTQRRWLENSLIDSDATWKVIVSSVPLSIPTAYSPNDKPDGWADGDTEGGYERELHGIFKSMQQNSVVNNVWLSGDVHFSAAFRYRPFPNDPQFQAFEFIAGPLHSGVFGNPRVDKTLGTERLFIHKPDDSRQIRTYAEAKRWMNFGLVEIDETGMFTVSLRDSDGRILYKKVLAPN